MSRLSYPLVIRVALLLCLPAAATPAQDGGVLPARARVTDPAWTARLDALHRVTAPALLESCERDGLVTNFLRVAGYADGPHCGGPTADGEVYRAIEVAARALAYRSDDSLVVQAGAVVEQLLEGQAEDGYLGTYAALEGTRGRWRDLRDGRELENLGFLIDAGLAWKEATGEGTLLQAARAFADLVDRRFGPDGVRDPPGHPGVELALLKLADATGEARYAELARFFVEQRGSEERATLYGKDYLDDLPVLDRRVASGHATESMRLFCAIAELARRTGEERLADAARTFFDDVARRKRYVTGGVGVGQAGVFGEAYDLPIERAACHTSAAAEYARWAHHTFLFTAHPTYLEELERALYNVLLAGGTPDGTRVSHANPLHGATARVLCGEARGDAADRARFLFALGERIYAHGDEDLYVLLHVGSEAEVPVAGTTVRVAQTTTYPAEGTVRLEIDPREPTYFALHVRAPAWCAEMIVSVNDARIRQKLEHGPDPGLFLSYRREWKPGDVVTLEIPLEPRVVTPDPRLAARQGFAAVARGPVVYGFEPVGGSLEGLYLPAPVTLDASGDPEPVLGVPLVTFKGLQVRNGSRRMVPLVGRPYAACGVEELGPIRVWLATQ